MEVKLTQDFGKCLTIQELSTATLANLPLNALFVKLVKPAQLITALLATQFAAELTINVLDADLYLPVIELISKHGLFCRFATTIAPAIIFPLFHSIFLDSFSHLEDSVLQVEETLDFISDYNLVDLVEFLVEQL
jgi:hypothetical protein